MKMCKKKKSIILLKVHCFIIYLILATFIAAAVFNNVHYAKYIVNTVKIYCFVTIL